MSGEVLFRLGEYLGEEMLERGWTSRDVARRMPNSDPVIDALFVDMVLAIDDPRAVISEANYRRMEIAFGVRDGFFEALDREWREHPERLSHYEAPDELFSGIVVSEPRP